MDPIFRGRYAQVWTEADVRRDGISVDDLLAEMHRKGATVKIVIIDAARRNPFERRFRASPAGLAALEAVKGLLVQVGGEAAGGASSRAMQWARAALLGAAAGAIVTFVIAKNLQSLDPTGGTRGFPVGPYRDEI